VAQEQPPGAPGASAARAKKSLLPARVARTHRDRVVGADRRPAGSDLAVQSTSNMLDTLSNMVPSFIVGQNSISDASSFVRSPSLRGLPATRCW